MKFRCCMRIIVTVFVSLSIFSLVSTEFTIPASSGHAISSSKWPSSHLNFSHDWKNFSSQMVWVEHESCDRRRRALGAIAPSAPVKLNAHWGNLRPCGKTFATDWLNTTAQGVCQTLPTMGESASCPLATQFKNWIETYAFGLTSGTYVKATLYFAKSCFRTIKLLQ